MEAWTAAEDERLLSMVGTWPWWMIGEQFKRCSVACALRWARLTRPVPAGLSLRQRVGSQVAGLRKSHRMSAETLAAEVGCSTRSIERLEAGETLSASLLERVLDYLDADLSVVTDYERAEEQP